MMDRQQLPPPAAELDMSSRASEIRVPARREGHDLRNGREALS